MDLWNNLVESGFEDPDQDFGALLRPLSRPNHARRHQFVVLLKPELLNAGSTVVSSAEILRLVATRMEKDDIELGGVRWFTGNELQVSKLMEGHYGVINEVSRRGLDALTDSQRDHFSDLFGNSVGPVFGAHAYLERHPSFSADELRVAFSSAAATKIAPGVYAAQVNIENTELVLLNGFHPAQLKHFTSADSRTIAFEYRADKPWSYLRNGVAGATDPARAMEGSLRHDFLRMREELGLREVSVNRNGIHLSAGPVEGCAELIRFFSTDDFEVSMNDTVLGSELNRAGVSSNRVSAALGNAIMHLGESIFDATEEMDIDNAIRLIANVPQENEM